MDNGKYDCQCRPLKSRHFTWSCGCLDLRFVFLLYIGTHTHTHTHTHTDVDIDIDMYIYLIKKLSCKNIFSMVLITNISIPFVLQVNQRDVNKFQMVSVNNIVFSLRIVIC